MFLYWQLMKQLFVALFRPHLEYRNVVWHSYLKKDMQLLEGVQHRATRMVPGLSKLNYEQRLKLMDLYPPCLTEECEATSLKCTSTWMGSTKWTVQIYSHATDLWDLQLVDIVWSLKNVTIKAGSVQISSDTGCVFNVWNSLPEDIVTASLVNCLKGRLDNLFDNDKYCENWEDGEWIYILNDHNSIQDEWTVYRQLHALWTVTDDDDDDEYK